MQRGAGANASGADSVVQAAKQLAEIKSNESFLLWAMLVQAVLVLVLLILSVSTEPVNEANMKTPDAVWFYGTQIVAFLIGAGLTRTGTGVAEVPRAIVFACVLTVTVGLSLAASVYFVIYTSWARTLNKRCNLKLKSTGCNSASLSLEHHSWNLFAFALIGMVSVHALVSRIVITVRATRKPVTFAQLTDLSLDLSSRPVSPVTAPARGAGSDL
eukprot:c17709_g1_i1.p1 GENE.c17709_g1_i1~~c17709_g1_i1.p1  ORF type:complete len:215 (-),score=38.33 c17709_g1_i1:15-659(-)